MPFQSVTHRHWQPKPCLPADIPMPWRHWVLSTQSLTAQLKNQWPHSFTVHILQQSRQWPKTSEAQVLPLTPHLAYIREVLLYADQKARIFARTVIPQATADAHPALLQLGNRPLGNLLFTHPHAQRGIIEVDRLPAAQLNAQLDHHYHHEIAWGRRSLFTLDHHPLLVSEIFLPHMLTP